jgi:hypothetical protein
MIIKKKRMQNFQEFVREQQIDSQYPDWTNHQRDEIITARWWEEHQKQPTRYVKFIKKELIQLNDTDMSPMEKMKLAAKKWSSTKYYKDFQLKHAQVQLDFPDISNNDAFSITKYRLAHKAKTPKMTR